MLNIVDILDNTSHDIFYDSVTKLQKESDDVDSIQDSKNLLSLLRECPSRNYAHSAGSRVPDSESQQFVGRAQQTFYA